MEGEAGETEIQGGGDQHGATWLLQVEMGSHINTMSSLLGEGTVDLRQAMQPSLCASSLSQGNSSPLGPSRHACGMGIRIPPFPGYRDGVSCRMLGQPLGPGGNKHIQ